MQVLENDRVGTDTRYTLQHNNPIARGNNMRTLYVVISIGMCQVRDFNWHHRSMCYLHCSQINHYTIKVQVGCSAE